MLALLRAERSELDGIKCKTEGLNDLYGKALEGSIRSGAASAGGYAPEARASIGMGAARRRRSRCALSNLSTCAVDMPPEAS